MKTGSIIAPQSCGTTPRAPISQNFQKCTAILDRTLLPCLWANIGGSTHWRFSTDSNRLQEISRRQEELRHQLQEQDEPLSAREGQLPQEHNRLSTASVCEREPDLTTMESGRGQIFVLTRAVKLVARDYAQEDYCPLM